MAKYINKYENKAAYDAAASERPTNASAASAVDSSAIIDGVNVVAPFASAKPGDHAFLDRNTGKCVVIRGGTLKTALLDSARYVNLKNVCIGNVYGHVIFVQYDQMPAEKYATGDEWTVSGFDLSASGSATLVVKTYGAAAANTYTVELSWNAGDSIDTIVAAIKAVSGLTTYAEVKKVDASTVGFVINGYSTSMGVTVSAGDVTATRTHQGWQARYYDGLPFGTGVLRHFGNIAGSFMANYEQFYYYYKTNGVAVASTIGGDTVKQSAFNSTTNPDLYEQFNGDYDAYMHAQYDATTAEYPTARSGLAALDIGDVCTATLAAEHHTRFDGEVIYDFPNAHRAHLAGVTVSGFETGFEPGTGHLGGLAEAYLLYKQLKRDKTDIINRSIREANGTPVDPTTTTRLALQSGSTNAWVFLGYGTVNYGSTRVYAYSARVFRAFKVDSLS